MESVWQPAGIAMFMSSHQFDLHCFPLIFFDFHVRAEISIMASMESAIWFNLGVRVFRPCYIWILAKLFIYTAEHTPAHMKVGHGIVGASGTSGASAQALAQK